MDRFAYTVHTVSTQDITMQAKINGVMTDVKVPGLVLELVNASEALTFRFVPVDMDAALATYVQGATINLELSAAE